MHNYTVPATLKAWLDQVVRFGRAFESTPDGKIGKLRDRPTWIVVSSGGYITGERARQPDFLTGYMSAILATIGIRDVTSSCSNRSIAAPKPWRKRITRLERGLLRQSRKSDHRLRSNSSVFSARARFMRPS